ncbi:unnamed protein product [Vitrella brassicaformis CCMP3155]|uniref:AB hydrolase-1 domain-containing protein n=2 Tax=Vitrella brassicaformis TaxID=1169539 RepID=A0A0G4F7I1_VITBC|nr:unnamed protein product [Vitrella brassicaformis CCMP3155]|eukprot:CEM08634.1 unnamed protein product [Vitrella brassicaformis CCMP3155]
MGRWLNVDIIVNDLLYVCKACLIITGVCVGGLFFITIGWIIWPVIYVVSEALCYWRWRYRLALLKSLPPYRPPVSQEWIEMCETAMLEDHTAEELRMLLYYCFYCVWPEQIGRRDVESFFMYHFPTSWEHIEWFVDQLEDKMGIRFPHVRSTTIPSQCPRTGDPMLLQDAYSRIHGYRFGIHPIKAIYRPLPFLIAINLWQSFSLWILKRYGFKTYEVPTNQFVRFHMWMPPKHFDVRRDRERSVPIVVLHGLGFGLINYVFPTLKLMQLMRTQSPRPRGYGRRFAPAPVCPRPVIVCEMSMIGGYPSGVADFRQLPTMPQIAHYVAQFVYAHFSPPTPFVPEEESETIGGGGALSISLPHGPSPGWEDVKSALTGTASTAIGTDSPSPLSSVVSPHTDAEGELQKRGTFFSAHSGTLTTQNTLDEDSPTLRRREEVERQREKKRRAEEARSLFGCGYRRKRQVDKEEEHVATLRFVPDHRRKGVHMDVVSHSFGTAITSILQKQYPSLIRRCVLVDPVCFFVLPLKKAQLGYLYPWEINLVDPPHGRGKGLFALIRRPLEKLYDFSQLFVTWLLAFRDLNTVWMYSRNLQGHEYLDCGEILQLQERMMVILSGRDVLLPAASIRRYLSRKCPAAKVIHMDWLPHGLPFVLPSVLKKVAVFLQAPPSKPQPQPQQPQATRDSSKLMIKDQEHSD